MLITVSTVAFDQKESPKILYGCYILQTVMYNDNNACLICISV